MKRTKKFKLLLLVTMIAGLFCSALFSVSAETGGTAPTEDLLITCQGLENGGVTNPSTSNPYGATGVDRFINVKDNDTSNFGIQTDGWFGVNYAVVLSFKTPIEAKWYEKIQFTLRSNLEGELEFYNSTTTNLVTANAKGIMSAVQYSKNTILLNANDFAAGDGFIHDITIKCASWTDNKGGVVYFGEIKFMLAESAPTEDVVLDCNNTDVTGQQSVNGTTTSNYTLKDDGEWGLFANSGGKFFASENIGSDGWMKIQLAKPLKAEYFEKVKIKFCIGNWHEGVVAKVAFFNLSDAEMQSPLAVVEETTGYKNLEMEISIAANSLADDDGFIKGFYIKRIEGNPGQHFFDKITFIVPEPDIEPTEDLYYECTKMAESFIKNPKTSNPNGVTTEGVVFDELADSGYNPENNLSYGISTKHNIGKPQEKEGGKVYNAVVLSFDKPIQAKWFEKIELTFFSGIKADLEFYDSETTDLVTANAKTKILAKNLNRYKFNTVKLKVADFANEDGVVTDITLKATNFADAEQYQLFFGEITLVKKTETSYLDELVLTDATEKSLILGENAQFITENIPESVNGIGAFDENGAVKITGNTTLTFKKIINQNETQCGNLFMRFYRAGNSGITKIKFSPVSNDKSFEEFDVSDKQGWFDLELSVRKYKNDIADIDNIKLEIEGDGELLFGGAAVQDKLRVYSEDITTNDISELLPMSEDGISYTSKDASARFVPIFERKDFNGDVVKFRLKISNLNSDFGIMVTLKGLFSSTMDSETGEPIETVEPTQGIWFWFGKDGVNSIAYETMLPYPEGVTADSWFEVELGTVPYQVNFSPYGQCAYMKINGIEMFRENVDEDKQLTGKCFGAYMHETTEGTTVSFASFSQETYQNTPVITLEIEDNEGSTKLELGNNDYRLKIGRNMLLNGQVISNPQIVSGDSIEIDDNGFISTKKVGDTVIRVTASASNEIPETVYELTVQVRKFWKVSIDGRSYKFEDGALIQLPELTPPIEGYTLLGLYLDEECKQIFDYENTPVTSDLTLYTGWTDKKGGCSCSGAISSAFYTLGGLALCAVVYILIKKRDVKQ
ncbi:MAG: hypothetical protein SOT08_01595 [Candidatus Borkfalkiaceae bacterium]|nr:hypothetical protein [Christensenellaceae bacterium]